MRGWLVLVTTMITMTTGFYLPGLAPVTYCVNEDMTTCTSDIKLYVNRLNSEESVIPYEYHQ